MRRGITYTFVYTLDINSSDKKGTEPRVHLSQGCKNIKADLLDI